MIMGSAMPVAKWELWTVAMTLIQTHGDDAEDVAASRLAEAEQEANLGNAVVWEEVLKLLPEVRVDLAKRE